MGVKGQLERILFPTFKHRVFALGATEGEGTALAANTDLYFTLLNCDDDPAADQITNHSTVAETHPGSDILDINLYLVIKAHQAHVHHLMVFKDRDGEFATSTPTGAFGTGDWSASQQQFRKNILSYKPLYFTSNSDARPMRIPISRAALMRNRTMGDGEALKLYIGNNSATNTLTWWLFGAITVRSQGGQ